MGVIHWVLTAILSTAALPLTAQTEPAVCEELRTPGAYSENSARYADALQQELAALDQARRRLGPEHATVAHMLMCVGAIHMAQRDITGAMAAFQESFKITERTLGTNHVQVGYALGDIAMLTHHEGYYAAAEPLYRRALAILANTLGPEHPSTGLLEVSIGKLYLAQGRNSDAEGLLEKAIPMLESAGDDPAIAAVALKDLAEAYRREGRYVRAEPFYDRVVLILQKYPEAANEEIRAGLRTYVQMLRKMKRKPEALQLERQIKTLLSTH